MAEKVNRLFYPPALSNVPEINALIRKYTELTANILQARVSSVESWFGVQSVGKAP